MNCQDAILKAREIIGEKSDRDYVISPGNHRDTYQEKSSELYEILQSSTLESTARRYEEEDKEAIEAQEKFNTVFNRANLTVLITAVIISIILAVGILVADTTEPPFSILLGALGFASIVTGALATKDLHMMKKGELLEIWMTKRAEAETTRLEYFEKLAEEKVQPASGQTNFAELLKLEYFKRYQLTVQLDYYSERAKDHKKDASRTLSLSSWAAAGTAIAAGTATFSFYNAILPAIAAFGVVFSALSSYAFAREGVYQYRRNSERYSRTSKTLEKLYERLDEVRLAVCEVGNQPLKEYIEVVHEQLSLEHRQWQGQLDESRGVYGRLDKTLNEVLSARPSSQESTH